MDKRNDKGQATRQHIVDVAKRLFAKKSYAGTSIEDVLQKCGMSRGALYHHFTNKEALFTAVLEAVEQSNAEILTAAAQGAANPLEALRLGCAAWLKQAQDPTLRQIVLIDAPSVVGWETWRGIDSHYGLGLLRKGLEMMAAAKRIPADKVNIYAHMLLAALIEMALIIARSKNAVKSVRDGQEAIEQLLSRLAGVEPNAPW